MVAGLRGMSTSSNDEEKTVNITWICGVETYTVEAPIGKTLLEVAKDNDIKLDGE